MARGGYAKWYDSAYDGTLRTDSPWQSLLIFPHLCALATADGILDMTPEVIQLKLGCPLEVVLAGIAGLEAPDPRSRTKRENGERLCRLVKGRDWGWRIVNHREYRDKKVTQEKHAEYMRKWRQKKKLRNGESDDARERSRDVIVNEREPSSRQYAVGSRKKDQLRGARARTNGPRLASPTGNSQGNSNGNHAGQATLLLTRIRLLAKRSDAVGNGVRVYIARSEVDAMGPAISQAYTAIGGADRVINTPPEKFGLLALDMAGALEAAGYDFAAGGSVSPSVSRETSAAGNTGNMAGEGGTGGNSAD
jgi:hypothetical protein